MKHWMSFADFIGDQRYIRHFLVYLAFHTLECHWYPNAKHWSGQYHWGDIWGKCNKAFFDWEICTESIQRLSCTWEMLKWDDGFWSDWPRLRIRSFSKFMWMKPIPHCQQEIIILCQQKVKVEQKLVEKNLCLSERSQTSKLWLSYLKMVKVARILVLEDRTGSWSTHLSSIAILITWNQLTYTFKVWRILKPEIQQYSEKFRWSD